MNHQKRTERHIVSNLDFVTLVENRGLVHDAEKRQFVSQVFNVISEREKRVLTLSSIGYDYAEIAEEIHVNPKTAEGILENLRKRIIASFPNVAAAYGAVLNRACTA